MVIEAVNNVFHWGDPPRSLESIALGRFCMRILYLLFFWFFSAKGMRRGSVGGRACERSGLKAAHPYRSPKQPGPGRYLHKKSPLRGCPNKKYLVVRSMLRLCSPALQLR